MALKLSFALFESWTVNGVKNFRESTKFFGLENRKEAGTKKSLWYNDKEPRNYNTIVEAVLFCIKSVLSARIANNARIGRIARV